MSLDFFTSRIAQLAPRKLRQRGRRYADEGRVGEIEVEPGVGAWACVRGSRVYEVAMEVEDGTLLMRCDCPYFQREEVCKHLVAFGHALDEREVCATLLGHEPAPRSNPRPHEPPADGPPRRHDDAPTKPPSWARRIMGIQRAIAEHAERAGEPEPTPVGAARYEVHIDVARSRADERFVLALARRQRLKKGGFGKVQSASWDRLHTYYRMPFHVRAQLQAVHRLQHAEDYGWRWRGGGWGNLSLPTHLAAQAVGDLPQELPLHARDADGTLHGPLAWSRDPWRFRVHVTQEASSEGGAIVVAGRLHRGEETRSLEEPLLLLSRGVVVFPDAIAPLDDAGAFAWIRDLRVHGELRVEAEDAAAFLPRLLGTTAEIPVDLGALAVPAGAPRGILSLASSRTAATDARVEFAYEGHTVAAGDAQGHVLLPGDPPRIMTRDRDAERELLRGLARILDVPLVPADFAAAPSLPTAGLAAACQRLLDAGWEVRIANQPVRSGGSFSMSVSSGIDWFDVRGTATFDEASLALPQILQAAQEGREFITLEDGSQAILPPEWRGRLEAIDAIGGRARKGEEAMVRIDRARAPLLDVLLAGFDDVEADARFEDLRGSLRRFAGIKPKREGKSFQGALRPYQRDALGWFAFLRDAGLGGCLADDMGLGKTVQVLACLAARRRAKDRTGPSLVVAPRSVMTNWIREAERFAPKLRTAIFHGPGREQVLERTDRLDLIVTTYGTLLRDIEDLAAIPLDYAILDESQAIKNPASKSARAVRLLQATHRLALSGTPIENSLEELGSLFAFLNPGLLGGRSEFQSLMGGKGTPDPERLRWLQAAIRPVVLRRTREQVLDELPEKEEQVIECQLTSKQRKDYDRIREHYRASVLQRIEDRGLAQSKMHVLEALLRLRQAACHPGLIDRKRAGEDAAKLDRLLPMLREIAAAGHKALVFSQFTSFLGIVRDRLDAEGIAYEYMDGRTRKRQERIDRFQDDLTSSAFLISLKAGGTGLNLTAAQYVFLLDPWWNPAVEAQAVGRAHRMGQTNRVLVYRLIGTDTVEDRVLELQARKRELVQAVLGGVADAPLRGITREDLEHLLG